MQTMSKSFEEVLLRRRDLCEKEIEKYSRELVTVQRNLSFWRNELHAVVTKLNGQGELIF